MDLRVILFEQSPDVLEKRFGFRVAQYGLRQVFPRVADHPLLAGITADELARLARRCRRFCRRGSITKCGR